MDQQRRLNARNSELERRNKELTQELAKKPPQVRLFKTVNLDVGWVIVSSRKLVRFSNKDSTKTNT